MARRLADGGIGAVHVVTAYADEEKFAMLARLSLSVAEQWWIRAVVPAVFPSPPGPDRAPELHARGWHVASDWYTGWPVAPGGS